MEPTYLEILKQEFGFTDEDIQQLISAGVLQGDLETIEENIRFSEEMAGRPGAQGRGFGGVYTAADPLEHAASGLERIGGHWLRHREGQQRRKTHQELAELRNLFLRGRNQRMGGGQPPASISYPMGTRPGTPNTGWTGGGY